MCFSENFVEVLALSLLQRVKQPAQCNHQRLQGLWHVRKVPALVFGSNRFLGIAKNCQLQHELSIQREGKISCGIFSQKHLALP